MGSVICFNDKVNQFFFNTILDYLQFIEYNLQRTITNLSDSGSTTLVGLSQYKDIAGQKHRVSP